MKLKLLFFLLTTQFLFGQITFTEVKKLGDTTAVKKFKYDGNSEFAQNLYKLFTDKPEYYMQEEKRQKDLLNYYKQYIGYDVFFLGKPEIFQNKKTKEFKNPNDNTVIITKLYNPICNKYCNKGEVKTEYIKNDSLKTYTSEYRILSVSFKAKDFGFDNERITYVKDSNIYQDENTINYDGNYNDTPIFQLLSISSKDTVFVNNMNNILFMPHYNFLKEKLDGKKLIYISKGGNEKYFEDLLTNERIVLKDKTILNSKIELLRNNAVYDLKVLYNEDSREKANLYYKRYAFSPFVVLTTEDNKKFAINEKRFVEEFSKDSDKILEYSAYLEELEMAKLAKLEQQKKNQEKKDKKETEKIERIKQLKNKYGEYLGTLISKNQVDIGMTKQMCSESLGKPYEIKTLIRQNLKYEVCYYYGGYKLYFLNDELKQIEY